MSAWSPHRQTLGPAEQDFQSPRFEMSSILYLWSKPVWCWGYSLSVLQLHLRALLGTCPTAQTCWLSLSPWMRKGSRGRFWWWRAFRCLRQRVGLSSPPSSQRGRPQMLSGPANAQLIQAKKRIHLWLPAVRVYTSHWQESRSREEMTHVFLSWAGELYFHFSFSSRFSRFLDNKSLSFLDLQDFLSQFSFSSRFSRLWRQKSLSTLDSWDSVLCFSFSSCEKCFIF